MSAAVAPRRLVLIFLSLAIAGLALAGVERLAPVREAAELVRRGDLQRSDFGSRKLLRSLNRLGVIHPDFRLAVTRRDGQLPPKNAYRYSKRRMPPEEMPSTLAVPPRVRRAGVPVISLVLSPADYAGLVRQPDRRGRRAERFTYVSYFDRGELLFASGAGLRVHGGLSRLVSPNKSFRLYFREDLGAAEFAPGILFDPGAEPLRRIVLHNDVRTDRSGADWHFIRPLGFDIAERFGAPVPRTSPAWLMVNGRRLGVYVLTEYLDRHYLESRFGHSEFMLVRERKNPGDVPLELGPEEVYRELRHWVSSHPRRLEMDTAAEVINVENLSRWFLAMLFCGATDSLQGPAILDLRRPDARWRWITWDMDHAFKEEWLVDPGTPPWEIDVLPSIVLHSGREAEGEHQRALRSRILGSLLETRRYRRYLGHLYQDISNHQVTPEFLRARFEHYRRTAAELGLENAAFNANVSPYLENRPRVMRDQLGRYLQMGESWRVTVEANERCPVTVDDREKRGRYVGWYFSGSRATIEPTEGCASFSHWTVNGVIVEGRTLARRVRENLDIRVVVAG